MRRPIDYEYLVAGPQGPAALLALVLAGLSNRVLFVPIAEDESSVPGILPAVPQTIVSSMYQEARTLLLERIQVLPGQVQVHTDVPLRTPGTWQVDQAGVVLPRTRTAWAPRAVLAPWYAGAWYLQDSALQGMPNIQQLAPVRTREIQVGRSRGKAIPVQVRGNTSRVHRVVQLAAGNWDVSRSNASEKSVQSANGVVRVYKDGICYVTAHLGMQIFQQQYPGIPAGELPGVGRRKQAWMQAAALARGGAWWYDATVGNVYGETDSVQL